VKYPVVLASASPRRQELLAHITTDFQVAVSDVDEDAYVEPDPWETAENIAAAKALDVAARYPEAIVIGGDTVVAYEDAGQMVQLAKPEDETDAQRMLRLLSGKRHFVVTGVCIASPDGGAVFHDTTYVTFRDLTLEEIAEYVAAGEPMDKAGAYAIQGGAKEFVTAVDGSLSNVIGLPLEELQETLERLNLA